MGTPTTSSVLKRTTAPTEPDAVTTSASAPAATTADPALVEPNTLVGKKATIVNQVGSLRHPFTGKIFGHMEEVVQEIDSFIAGQIRQRRVKATLVGEDEPVKVAGGDAEPVKRAPEPQGQVPQSTVEALLKSEDGPEGDAAHPEDPPAPEGDKE